MNVPSAEVMSQMFGDVVEAASAASPRSVQSLDGIIGPSDLGFCRQKAALMTKGEEQSDSKATWAAAVGTSVHTFLADAFGSRFPDWVCDNTRVTAKFPNGASVSGTPDIIIPEWNMIVDHKTVDGFTWVKREGVSQNHKYQRHTYAMGAIAAGLLDPKQTVYVTNVYWDRSGKESKPYVVVAEFDPTLTDEISAWIDDVTYAVKQGEDASRDIPAPVCEKICEFYTVCRGSLPMDTSELITDPMLLEAVDLYVQGRDMAKEGDSMKRSAQAILSGLNGSTGEYQVRTTQVNPTTVQSFEKQGYERLDVRKVRRAAKDSV